MPVHTSINAATKASGINYRTAQRIVEAAAAYRQRQLAAVGLTDRVLRRFLSVPSRPRPRIVRSRANNSFP